MSANRKKVLLKTFLVAKFYSYKKEEHSVPLFLILPIYP